MHLWSEASVRGTRSWVVLAAAIALLFGLLLGGLASVSLTAALGLSGVVLLVSAIAVDLSGLALTVLVFAVGVPATTSALNIPLGIARPSLQLLLPLAVAVAAAMTAPTEAVEQLLYRLRHGASGMLLLWVLSALAFFAYGAMEHGVSAAGYDLMVLSLYVWVIVPLLLFGRPDELSLLLRAIVLAMAISACIALLLFAAPGLRHLFLSEPLDVITNRVGFGAADVYIVGLPVCLILLSREGIGGKDRLALLLCSVLMVAATAVAQNRVLMVTIILNVALVFVAPRLWKGGLRRWRLVEQATLAVVVLVALFATMTWLGPESSRSLPTVLAQRLAEALSYQQVNSFQTREYTNAVAYERWRADTRTLLFGEGLGARFVYINPVTRRPATDPGPFIDSVWMSLAVKGGLVLLAFWALALVACFASLIRAAKRSQGTVEGSIWLTSALCFPAFVFGTTAMTHHLVSKEAVVVAFVTIVAAADLSALNRATGSQPEPTTRPEVT